MPQNLTNEKSNLVQVRAKLIGAVRQQAITRTNVDQLYVAVWRHLTSMSFTHC